MYDFEVEVPIRTDTGGGSRDRYATGVTDGRNPRCQISGVRNPLELAYDAKPGRRGKPLRLDDEPVSFACPVLAAAPH